MEINWSPTATPLHGCVPLQQSRQYGAALALLDRKTITATITRKNTVLATAQIMLRPITGYAGIALLPRGPIWHPDMRPAQMHAAISLITQNVPLPRLRALITNCNHPSDDSVMGQQGAIPIVTPQHTASLDLDLPQDTRLAAQSVKWRNRLRAAQKSRLKISHVGFSEDGSRNNFQWLLLKDDKQRRAKHYRGLPAQFTTAFARANPTSTRLFTASCQGTTVAAMLFLLHGRGATYHIGWINAEGRLLSAHNLVLWKAANYLAHNGYSSLDLGIVDTESAAGLARFKIGTGAQIQALGSTWLYTPLTAGPTRLMAHIPPRRRQYHSNA